MSAHVPRQQSPLPPDKICDHVSAKSFRIASSNPLAGDFPSKTRFVQRPFKIVWVWLPDQTAPAALKARLETKSKGVLVTLNCLAAVSAFQSARGELPPFTLAWRIT